MAIRVLFLDFEMFEVRFRNVVGVVCGFFFRLDLFESNMCMLFCSNSMYCFVVEICIWFVL